MVSVNQKGSGDKKVKLHGGLGDSSSRWTVHVSYVKLSAVSDLRIDDILAVRELDEHVHALESSFPPVVYSII